MPPCTTGPPSLTTPKSMYLHRLKMQVSRRTKKYKQCILRAAQEDKDGYCEEMQGTSDINRSSMVTYICKNKTPGRPSEPLRGLQDIPKTSKFECGI